MLTASIQVVVFQGTSNPTCSPSSCLGIFPSPPCNFIPAPLEKPPDPPRNVVGFLSRIRPTNSLLHRFSLPPSRRKKTGTGARFVLFPITRFDREYVGYGNGGRTAMILRGFRSRIVEIANAYFTEPGGGGTRLVSRLLQDNF